MPDYKTEAGLLEHLQIQKQSIAQFKAEAAADTEDITSISEDHDNLKATIEFCTLVDEYRSSAFGIKRVLARGEIGEDVGTIMNAPVFTPPFALVAGIEKRTRERDQRFKRSKAMTEAALIGLDLKDGESSGISPGEVKPSIEVTAANSGYLFAVVVTGRAGSSSWDVLVRRAGFEKWVNVKTATGKSVDVEIDPTNEGKPEQLQVMVQLKKNNQNYGQPSDIVSVTVNP